MSEASSEQSFMNYAMIARAHVLSVCTDKIVKRKTVVYSTLVDPTVVKVTGERLKRRLFTRFGILKPNPALIQLASMEKYYEPYIVISGRYFLDYYRLCTYNVSIDNDVREVILFDKKFDPVKYQNSTASIKLEGEDDLSSRKNHSSCYPKTDKKRTWKRCLPRLQKRTLERLLQIKVSLK